MNIYIHYILVGEKGIRKILKVQPQVQDIENIDHTYNSVSAQVIYTHCFSISAWEVELRLTFIVVELGNLSPKGDGKVL